MRLASAGAAGTMRRVRDADVVDARDRDHQYVCRADGL